MFGKQKKTKRTDEQNSHQENSLKLPNFPDELLLMIKDFVPSPKDSAWLASVNLRFHGLFQRDIGTKEANDAEKCVILPTEENVEKLKALLKKCPPLLLHPVTVENRHGMAIKGTIYQIALHEGDDELIEDVIKPAFERLHQGLETMETQRKDWLPEGWMEAEEQVLASVFEAIDNVFTAFKNASDPNDFTELPHHPFTITINNEAASAALKACREAIDALYQPIEKVIKHGRDPSMRLLERVIDRYIENFDALGGQYHAPRNNAVMRSLYGYGQRSAPVNFMQAFAQLIHYLVKENKKLSRKFEYKDMPGHSILPLDSDPNFRLGNDYFAGGCTGGWVGACDREYIKLFLNRKQQIYTHALCNIQSKTLNHSVSAV